MRYLLDTCVLSEVIKPKPDSHVLNWIREEDEESLFLSVLTLGEIHRGIAKLPESKRKHGLSKWVQEDLRSRFSGRIIPISDEVASLWGSLSGASEKQGRRLPVIDALLAASALAHQLVLVTRHTSDIEQISGIQFLNPWEAE